MLLYEYIKGVICHIFGLVEGSRSNLIRRGDSPLFFYGEEMKELSIFVDESGDFGAYEKHAPYYIVTMVLHDQSVDINSEIKKLDEALLHLGYANGQHELNRILNTVLATELADYDVRKVMPNDYKLFQVADLICTLELLEQKIQDGEMSKSEQLLFHSKRDLKKDFIKGIHKKRF